MSSVLAFASLLALEPRQELPLDAEGRVTQQDTRIEAVCLGHGVSVTYFGGYPGLHGITDITVSGTRLRPGQDAVLRAFVGTKTIDTVTITRCEENGGILTVWMLVDFGSASAVREGSAEHRSLAVRDGIVFFPGGRQR